MSDELYKEHPELKDDPSMKKIDEIMCIENLDKALNDIDSVLNNASLNLDNLKKAHAYVHKGTIYYRKGDFDQAKSMWNTAKRIYPDDKDATFNLDKMEKSLSSKHPK
jgi:tetratricopeptide (TPR) repeat protein